MTARKGGIFTIGTRTSPWFVATMSPTCSSSDLLNFLLELLFMLEDLPAVPHLLLEKLVNNVCPLCKNITSMPLHVPFCSTLNLLVPSPAQLHHLFDVFLYALAPAAPYFF